ncbi:hypothetical protein DPEC_G00253880 [Dallia pectoralis]|uniref:Uncharacterized protein n=1 Tax=Dallia pectoralis TaxID=75939 RepID=A0ACC2FTY7_DALPE|nr:hypothetical protein DPEC_G00253880 [Dallia pectoralis]
MTDTIRRTDGQELGVEAESGTFCEETQSADGELSKLAPQFQGRPDGGLLLCLKRQLKSSPPQSHSILTV